VAIFCVASKWAIVTGCDKNETVGMFSNTNWPAAGLNSNPDCWSLTWTVEICDSRSNDATTGPTAEIRSFSAHNFFLFFKRNKENKNFSSVHWKIQKIKRDFVKFLKTTFFWNTNNIESSNPRKKKKKYPRKQTQIHIIRFHAKQTCLKKQKKKKKRTLQQNTNEQN
jgi:hypothetical protein